MSVREVGESWLVEVVAILGRVWWMKVEYGSRGCVWRFLHYGRYRLVLICFETVHLRRG